MKFISLTETCSTNLYARGLAEQGERGPLWVSAQQQSAGVGRRGREWVSGLGNLYASGLYPNAGTASDAALMSFAAALAVADSLEPYVARDLISLKWPNDVLLGGKKTAGILLEGGPNWFIVGVGINLMHHPEAAQFPATHVLEHISPEKLEGPEPVMTGPQAVLALLASRFNYWRDIYLIHGFEPLRMAWSARAHNIQGEVTVNLSGGSFSGRADGLCENGALRVVLADGTIRDVQAGDVFFGSTAPKD